MPSANSLEDLQRRHRQLAGLIPNLGLISQGSLLLRYTKCGSKTCRCHADPPQLHGPYWQWSRRDPETGKTLTRRLSERQATLYQEWIANRHRLNEIVAEMEHVCAQAAEILAFGDRSSAE